MTDQELKKKFAAAIGTYQNELTNSIAESCIKIAKEYANYQKSLPDPSLEEIKERFYTAAGRGDLQNSTDLVDVDAVWEWIEENCFTIPKNGEEKSRF